MTFEKGDKIFNAAGGERTVAVDKRETGGYLWADATWGKGRERLQGPWFLRDTANAALSLFFQRTEVSAEPLREQEFALSKRQRRLHAYARLVAFVAANGYVSPSLAAEVMVDADGRMLGRRDVVAKLGEPDHVGDHGGFGKGQGYKATVGGLPHKVVVGVYGPDGSLNIEPSGDFQSG